MELENLTTDMINNMSTEDLRKTLNEAYVNRQLAIMHEADERKAEEERKAEGQRTVDAYFANKFANLRRNGK